LGAVAENVVATVTFFDERGRGVLSIPGRWAETPQPPEKQRIGLDLQHRGIDVHPNAVAHPLDIVMKYLPDDSCYAYNNDNGTYAADARFPKHELRGEWFRVRVTLRGNNLKEQYGEFTLHNPGRDLKLELHQGSAVPASS
jgi:hypothetical protein